MKLLCVQKLAKHFGGVTALNQVSFDIDTGQIKGVIGPNGAGKSTLFNCISGFERFDEGEISFGEEAHKLANGNQRAALRAGITRSFQTPALFDAMTVRENLQVPLVASAGSHFFRAVFSSVLPPVRQSRRETAQECERVLAAFDIRQWADTYAGDLPAGTRRIVELARACSAGTVDALTSRMHGVLRPRLLLLDEPAAGLNPGETRVLTEHIRQVRNLGITILLVEHDLSLVMGLCDEVMVLDYGRKIAEGSPRIIQRDPLVIEAYLGTRHRAERERGNANL